MKDVALTPAQNRKAKQEIRDRSIAFLAAREGITVDEFMATDHAKEAERNELTRSTMVRCWNEGDFNHMMEHLPEADRIIWDRAFELSLNVVRDYFSIRAYPMLEGSQRDRWLIKKMRKIRDKYIRPVEID